MITQIAKGDLSSDCIVEEKEDLAVRCKTPVPTEEEEVVETCDTTEECVDGCDDEILNLDWTYDVWTGSDMYLRNYTPVRLATGTFFNSLVCKEKDESLYLTCTDEYTIIGETEKRLRFNFIEGNIAISFMKNSVDKETGYPLIPDNISYITAITYFIKWKIAEMYDWAGREGWSSKAEKAEAKWIKYVKQAKNYMKMPKTLDQFQNMLEQTHYLIPNHKRYYSYFGNLGKSQERQFSGLNRTRNGY